MDLHDSRSKCSTILGWIPLCPSAPGQGIPLPRQVRDQVQVSFKFGFEEREK